MIVRVQLFRGNWLFDFYIRKINDGISQESKFNLD